MKISVTQQNIDAGDWDLGSCNPITRALRDHGIPKCYVSESGISTSWFGPIDFPLPDAAIARMREGRKGSLVLPFSLEVPGIEAFAVRKQNGDTP